MVDLPQPEGPTIAVRLPAGKVKEASRRIGGRLLDGS